MSEQRESSAPQGRGAANSACPACSNNFVSPLDSLSLTCGVCGASRRRGSFQEALPDDPRRDSIPSARRRGSEKEGESSCAERPLADPRANLEGRPKDDEDYSDNAAPHSRDNSSNQRVLLHNNRETLEDQDEEKEPDPQETNEATSAGVGEAMKKREASTPEGPWTCPTCTYLNMDSLHLTCSMCFTPRKEDSHLELQQYQEQNNDCEDSHRRTVTKSLASSTISSITEISGTEDLPGLNMITELVYPEEECKEELNTEEQRRQELEMLMAGFRVDPMHPTWSDDDMPPMIQKRSSFAVVAIGSYKFMAIGGWDGSHILSSVELYQIGLKQWEPWPPLNQERSGHVAAFLNNKVYVFGGYNKTYLDSIELLDLRKANSQWELLETKLSCSRFGSAVALVGTNVYIIGGNYASSVDIFDTTTHTIRQGPKMTKVRRGCVAGVVGNTIYTFGGHSATSRTLETIECLDTDRDTEWKLCEARLSQSKSWMALAGWQSCFVIMGGNGSGERGSPSVDLFDTKRDVCFRLPNLTVRRGRGPAAVVLGNTVYLMGGASDDSNLLASMEFVRLQKAELDEQRWAMVQWKHRTANEQTGLPEKAKQRIIELEKECQSTSNQLLKSNQVIRDLQAKVTEMEEAKLKAKPHCEPFSQSQKEETPHAPKKMNLLDEQAEKQINEPQLRQRQNETELEGLLRQRERTTAQLIDHLLLDSDIESRAQLDDMIDDLSKQTDEVAQQIRRLQLLRMLEQFRSQDNLEQEEQALIKTMKVKSTSESLKLVQRLIQLQDQRDHEARAGANSQARSGQTTGRDNLATKFLPTFAQRKRVHDEKDHETSAARNLHAKGDKKTGRDRHDNMGSGFHEAGHRLLLSFQEKEIESRKIARTRFDYFLSFHGSEELLGGRYSMREVARDLKAGILQRRWEGRFARKGELSIFFDDHNLGERADGVIDRAIRDGLLQTRGGGFVVILATKGYFMRQWCLTELLAAIKLASNEDMPQSRPNICLIAIDISVAEIQGLKFMKDHGDGLLDRLVCHQAKLPDDIYTTTNAIDTLEIEIADLILSRGKQVLPGATEDYSLVLMKSVVLKNLQRGDLDVITSDHVGGILKSHIDADPLVVELKLHLDVTHPARAFVDAFERKWKAEWCTARNWIDEREELAAIQQVAKLHLAEVEAGTQTRSRAPGPERKLFHSHQKISVPDLVKEDSLSSSDGEDGFLVIISLAEASLEDHLHDALLKEENRDRIKKILSRLAKYGETKDDTFISVDKINGRAIATLECDINFDEMKPKFRRAVEKTIKSFERLLIKDVGIPEASVREILYVSFNRGSLEVLVQTDSDTLERLFSKLVESNMRLSLPAPSNNAHLVALATAYFVTVPFAVSVPLRKRQSPPGAWLWKRDGVSLLCPTSESTRAHLVVGGVTSGELATNNAWMSLPTIKDIPKTMSVITRPPTKTEGSHGLIHEIRTRNETIAKDLNSEGHAFFDIGDYDQALKKYRKAISLDPSAPFHWSDLAACYEKQHEYGLMILASRQCINADHTLELGYTWLATAQKKFGDYSGSMRTIDTGLSIHPTNSDLRRMRQTIIAFWEEEVGELLRTERLRRRKANKRRRYEEQRRREEEEAELRRRLEDEQQYLEEEYEDKKGKVPNSSQKEQQSFSEDAGGGGVQKLNEIGAMNPAPLDDFHRPVPHSVQQLAEQNDQIEDAESTDREDW